MSLLVFGFVSLRFRTSEFHRLRNAMFTRHNLLHGDMEEAVKEDSINSTVLLDGSKPTCIAYKGEGVSIAVKGSFDGWTESWPLRRKTIESPAELWLSLPPGEYLYKFLVDGEWLVSGDYPRKQEDGFENNLLVLT